MYNNPYAGENFFSFFVVLFGRLFGFLSGRLSADEMVSDEVQLCVLSGVAISAALVGTFLVLRKMTMLANSLSHTILVGIVVAFLIFGTSELNFGVLVVAALLAGFLTTFLTEFVTKVMRLQEDASIGLVFTSLFALGVILAPLFTRSRRLGNEAIMGNVDALRISDIKLVFGVL